MPLDLISSQIPEGRDMNCLLSPGSPYLRCAGLVDMLSEDHRTCLIRFKMFRDFEEKMRHREASQIHHAANFAREPGLLRRDNGSAQHRGTHSRPNGATQLDRIDHRQTLIFLVKFGNNP